MSRLPSRIVISCVALCLALGSLIGVDGELAAHATPMQRMLMTSPTLSTLPSGSITIGGTVSDGAMLSGAGNPTGTITFTLYGPHSTPSCTSANRVFTSDPSLVQPGPSQQYASHPAYTPATAGTYYWIASYSGDGANTPVATSCGESVVVNKATPGISITANATADIGGYAADAAYLQNAHNPTGFITFKLYGPNTSTCTGKTASTSTRPVNGTGPYLSDAFRPLVMGTYHWVAAYSGDANNAAAASTCKQSGETTTVSGYAPATPKTSVLASTTKPACTGSTGLQLRLTATVHSSSSLKQASLQVSGTFSFTDSARHVTITKGQVKTVLLSGTTAAVYGPAQQNGKAVGVRITVRDDGKHACAGQVDVTSSAGYDSGQKSVNKAWVTALQ